MIVTIVEVPKLPGVLDALLEAVVCINTAILQSAQEFPHPYEAGLWWEREKERHEDWRTITEVMARRDAGEGSDCEDLACAVAAFYRVKLGEPAMAIAIELVPGHWHAVVERADGTIEDPSKIVGRRRPR